MGDTYICSVCDNEYKKGWTDEEAEKEMLETFGDFTIDECDVVCDDCYKKFMGWWLEETDGE